MKTYLLVALVAGLHSVLIAEPIEIKGSNGRIIPFDGIREAVPQGLWLRVREGGEEVAVTWSKLDLDALESDHPEIHAAYLKSQSGESTLLELGSYERPLINLPIAEAIEKVESHTEAKPHPNADNLELKPYLYRSGGDDHPLPFRFYAPATELREGDGNFPLIVWLHGAGSGGNDNFKNANLNLARKLTEHEQDSFFLCPQFHDEYNWWTYVSKSGQPKRGVPGK
ncbi:MAG: hypothetical protein AAF357_17815, partial [Verrucomicrobiota bacterium]